MENLRKQIQSFVPCNPQEETDRQLLLQWLESGKDILNRENQIAHMTASAWVVSPDKTKVLMAYHNLYDSWAWLGGHADGEADLRAVAAREAMEESGIRQVRPLSDGPISVEILSVAGHEKKGRYVSCHLHLNMTYLFEADPEESLQIKADENSQVGWISVDEIPEKSTEPWFVERIYAKLCARMHTFPTHD